MKLKGRTAIYNHLRDYRNDHWAVIFGLAFGWSVDSLFGYSSTNALISAWIGMAAFRIIIWYTPWSESIRWESNENIYSTQWQSMTISDEVCRKCDD